MHLTTRLATGATVIALAAAPGLGVAAGSASEQQPQAAVTSGVDDHKAPQTESGSTVS